MYANGYLDLQSNDYLRAINLTNLRVVSKSLDIYTNAVLATISLPSLSAVIATLRINQNPSLTLAQLPVLTFLGDRISICVNNAAFLIPSSPPNAPTGGLVVTGSNKGTSNCVLSQGSAICTSTRCP
jgi:hypothetical protein